MKTKKTNRILSLILSLAMTLSIVVFPNTVSFAELDKSEGYSDKRADISVEYLGTSTGDLANVYESLPSGDISDFEWTPNDYIWVGVYFEHMDRLADMFGSDGLLTLTFSMLYNTDYLSWSNTDCATVFNLLNGQYDSYQEGTKTTTYPWTKQGPMTKSHYKATGSNNTLQSFKQTEEWDEIYPIVFPDYESAENISAARNVIRYDSATMGDSAQHMFTGDYLKADKTLVAIFPFKMTGSTPAEGTKILSGTYSPSMFVINTTGETSYSFGKTRTNDENLNLNNRFNIVNNVVDLFPTDRETLESIAASGSVKTTYIAGNKFDPSGLTVTPTTNKGAKDAVTPTASDWKGLKFYWADDAASAETLSKDAAHEITLSEALTTDLNGKYVYVVYEGYSGTKAALVSSTPLTVSARQISTITIDSESVTDPAATTFGTASAYYTTQQIHDLLTRSTDPETLVVDIAYDNGDTDNNVSYAQFADKGIALYKKAADDKLVKVENTDKFTEGSNEFYVAKADLDASATATGTTPISAVITITAQADTLYLTAADASDAKTKYKEGDTIDLKDVLLTTKNVSAGTSGAANPAAKYSTFAVGDIIFYIGTGTDTDPAHNTYDAASSTKIESGTTAYSSSDHKGKNIFAVHKDDTTKAVYVCTLGDRSIQSATVSGTVTSATTQYGDKLGDATTDGQLSLTFDNGDTAETVELYDELADKGIKARIVGADGTEIADDVNKDTVLKPDMNGAHIEFYLDGDASKTPLGQTSALTVNKKKLTVTAAAATIEKVYDGTTALEADDVPALTFDTTGMVTGDDAKYNNDNLTVTGITYAYEDKTAGENKAVKVTKTAPGVAKKGTDTDDTVTEFSALYELDAAAVADTTGKITKKDITITEITNVPALGFGATTLSGTETMPLTAAQGIVENDNVGLTYKYEYASSAQDGEVDVNITSTGTEGAVALGLTGTDAANYNLLSAPATAKGRVNKNLESLTVTGFENSTYPKTKLDITNAQITIKYEGTAAQPPMSVEDFIKNQNGVMTFTDKAGDTVTVTKDNYDTYFGAAAAGVELKYGATEIKFILNNEETKAATATVTVNRKPIKLSDVTFTADQVYGDASTLNKSVTLPQGTKEGDDDVSIDFTPTFRDDNAGENKPFTAGDITLTGDDSDNYVIVDDSDQPITAAATAQGTGTVSQGVQTPPAEPTVSIDPKTNSVVIEGPLGEDIEYSIDGTTWQKEPLFPNRPTGQTLTVQARKAQTQDGNYAPSEPSSKQTTTFKNRVRLFKKGATDKNTDTPEIQVYTDTASAADENALHNILGGTPDKFKAYYSDPDLTTDLPFPLTLTSDTVVYMDTKSSSRSSSGGGGGGISITFDETKIEGTAGDTMTLKPTVSGTSNPLTWKSSDETVATVDENGKVTLLKEGEVKITASVSGTQKSVTITVKPAPEQTAAPAPTPTPAPLIDETYTKPYASGYLDESFRPENNITRAELASMIARLINGDDIADGAYTSSFGDVAPDAWYNKYVGYLEAYDVISGYEDGTFRPENRVTRSEMCAVVARAQRFDILTADGMFSDVTADDWAKDYIATLASKGIVSGYGDTFEPYGNLTRAEAVTIINNVLAPSEPIVTFTPNDISGHWAEANIILAVNERKVNE